MNYAIIWRLLAVERCRRCRDAGLSVKEIAKSAGVSPSTVYRWLKTF